jgi:hypothetical protein
MGLVPIFMCSNLSTETTLLEDLPVKTEIPGTHDIHEKTCLSVKTRIAVMDHQHRVGIIELST